MGAGLAGRRDKAFLMSKMCTHGQGRDVGMRQLEESLKRLRTDHLDLWMLHAVQTEEEVESAYAPGGALEALTEAKRQGKVRYLGFTGHASPSLHLKMLEGGFPFDAVLMPLSVFDGTREDGFQRRVLPELVKRGVAALGMKSLGGNARAVKDGMLTAREAVRYALSLPVATLALGIDKMAWLDEGLAVARSFTPMTPAEKAALEERCRTGTKYEGYRR
jgi:predicted aldo/keto reductase-like oxidoreductase